MTQLNKHLTLWRVGVLSTARSRAAAATRSSSMAPLAGAAKAAVEDLFKSRRGARALHPDVHTAMAAYFVGKGLTVPRPTPVAQARLLHAHAKDQRPILTSMGTS